MGYRSQGNLADFGARDPLIQAQRRTVERVGKMLKERVVLHTPVAKPPAAEIAGDWLAARKRAPGTLKASWEIGHLRIEGDVMGIDVESHDPIAKYVEYPTSPHLIVAHGGRLRFWASGSHPDYPAGTVVYAQIVHHTGTKGSYMMTTAIGEVAVMWQDVGAEEMETWAREQRAQVGR